MVFKYKNFEKDELLSLISSAPTLAGLCITIVAVINTFNHEQAIRRVSDDIFAFCALGFLLCTCLIFIALRVHQASTVGFLIVAIDMLFLASLTLMTIGSFLLIYSIL